MSPVPERTGTLLANQGAGQAAAQVLVWLLQDVVGVPVPAQVGVALGVLIGDVAYRLKWERLLRSYKGKS